MTKLIRLGLPFATAAAMTMTATAASAQRQPTGDWQYGGNAESCWAYREYGAGDTRGLLQLRSYGPGSTVEVTVAGPNVPKEPNSVRMVELGWDGKGFEDHQLGLLGSAGPIPSVSMLTAHRPTAAFVFFYSDTAVAVSPLDPAAQTMQLRVVGGEPNSLEMGPLQDPINRLEECEGGLMEKWGWGRDYAQRVATPPQMLDPQSWFFKAIVYPAVQDLKRVSSFLQLRLKVDANGRVAECVVQSSPGSSLFGSKNCAGIRKMGRFKPALDPQGQPVDSYMQRSITFSRTD